MGYFAALVALLVAGCGDLSRVRIQVGVSNVGHASPRVVAVAPFRSLSQAPQAGAAMRAAVVNALRRQRRFEVVEIEEVGPGDRAGAVSAARALRADSVLLGEVTAYDYQVVHRGRSAMPSIGLDVKLLAGDTGEVMWAAGLEGKDVRLLSYDTMPLAALAQDVAEELAEALGHLR